jgi:integrase
MASIKTTTNKRGKHRYRVRVRTGGACLSKTFSNKAEAERWARITEDRVELNCMGATGQATVRTVGEMIDRYCREILPGKAKNTQISQHAQLMFWKSQIGKLTLAKTTTPVIAEVKAALAPRGTATINCYLAALQHAFTVAVKEWEWLTSNPVKNVVRRPPPPSRVRTLSPAERTQLLFYARLAPCKLLETMIVVALSTGPRKSEIRNMKFSDYDRRRSVIVLNETKNKERRTVRLFGPAAQMMADLYDRRQPDQVYFFPSPQDPRRPHDIRYSWEWTLEQAEIPNCCFHDLRHSAASYLAAQGATLADIKEILGHKSIQTTLKYTHLTESRTAALIQKMNQAIS